MAVNKNEKMETNDDELSELCLSENPTKPAVAFNEIMETFQRLDDSKKSDYIDTYIEMSWKNPMLYVTRDQHIEIFERIGVPLDTKLAIKKVEERCLDHREGGNVLANADKTSEFDFKIPATKQEGQNEEKHQRRDNVACWDAQTFKEESGLEGGNVLANADQTSEFDFKIPATKQEGQNEEKHQRRNNVACLDAQTFKEESGRQNEDTEDKVLKSMLPPNIDSTDNVDTKSSNEAIGCHKQETKENDANFAKPILPPALNSRLSSRRVTTFFDKKEHSVKKRVKEIEETTECA